MKTYDYLQEAKRLATFIKAQLQNAGLNNLVVGLSGGVDSSLTAALCVQAVGPDNVFGLMLPYKNSHPDSLADAELVAKHLGINYQVVPVTPMVDAYFNTYHPDAEPLRRGNYMARMRMSILYDYSARNKALVAGTGNKSELLIGYVTQYGDGACAFEPLGHLYKTQVWEMSAALGLPARVINKPPTADLWDGQTDESELGISYKRLDLLLEAIWDDKLANDKLLQAGYTQHEIDLVNRLIARSEFKRHLPPQPEA